MSELDILKEAARNVLKYETTPTEILEARQRVQKWYEGGGWDKRGYEGVDDVVQAVVADHALLDRWNNGRLGALEELRKLSE